MRVLPGPAPPSGPPTTTPATPDPDRNAVFGEEEHCLCALLLKGADDAYRAAQPHALFAADRQRPVRLWAIRIVEKQHSAGPHSTKLIHVVRLGRNVEIVCRNGTEILAGLIMLASHIVDAVVYQLQGRSAVRNLR